MDDDKAALAGELCSWYVISEKTMFQQGFNLVIIRWRLLATHNTGRKLVACVSQHYVFVYA